MQYLARTTELMTFVARQLATGSAVTEVPLVPEKVNLSESTQRFVAYYEPAANHKKVEILCEVEKSAEGRADRMALLTVLDNLISNAVKYTPSGKRIAVSLKTEPGHIVWTVADEGPGLTSADQAKLFEQGTRLSSNPTRGESRSGFGLFI